MRVLMLSGIYDSGGFTRVVENLANELGARGVDVTISALHFKRFPSKGKYNVCAFPLGNSRFLDDFDIVHNHHPLTNYLSFKTRSPFIYHYHGAPDSGSSYIYRMSMLTSIRFVKNNFSSAIALSKNGADELRRYFKIRNLYLVPNGVDNCSFRPKLEEKFRKGTPQLLFVGNLYEHKRVEDLLYALKLLLITYPEAHLQLVGKGKTYSKLRNLADELGILKHVNFCGYVPDYILPNYYCSCDLYVTASGYEQFPLPLNEAWACGKPVVASSILPHQELLLASKAGMLYKLGDIQDLCAKVKYVYEHKEDFTYEALQFAKEHDWTVITDQIMQVYANAVSG